jgi:hypothetical protein
MAHSKDSRVQHRFHRKLPRALIPILLGQLLRSLISKNKGAFHSYRVLFLSLLAARSCHQVLVLERHMQGKR